MPPLAPVYRYRARCLRIIDADTLDVEVDLGFRTHIRTPLRLLGLNAPERNTDAGRRAIEWVALWISHTGLATVWDQQGRCLNTELVEAGHAVAMAG